MDYINGSISDQLIICIQAVWLTGAIFPDLERAGHKGLLKCSFLESKLKAENRTIKLKYDIELFLFVYKLYYWLGIIHLL